MKKFLVTLLLVIVVAVGLSISYVWTTRTALVASAVSEAMRMPVSIGDIAIKDKRIVVTDFEVSNPPGHRLHKAFVAKEIVIDLAVADLMANPIVIEQVNIRDATIGIEMYSMNGEKNNWAEVLEAIPNEATPEQKAGRQFLIRNLVIDNFRIEARNKFVAKAIIRPPPIKHVEFKDVGTESPLARDQIVELIASAILTEVRKFPGLGNILREVQMLPVRGLKALFSPLGLKMESTIKDQAGPAKNVVADFSRFIDRVFGNAAKEEEESEQ